MLQLKLDNYIANENLAGKVTDANYLLKKAYSNDEELWRQKARVDWLQSGDQNTAYFHAMARIKRSKNFIHTIQTEDGRMIDDQDVIKDHIVCFFTEKFAYKAHHHDDSVLEQVSNVISSSDNDGLIGIPLEDEIKKAVFDLNPNSSSGLDGFSGILFQSCWGIAGLDVMYKEASGQVFRSEKSKLFLGAMNNGKKQVKDIFGFDEGCLPETYLGIPLIQGRMTKEILQPLVDKIKKRATGWAGSLLSIQGRALLIKSVLSGISIYSMGIYKWTTSMIKEGERILRNSFSLGKRIQRKPLLLLGISFSTCTKGSSIWAGVRGALEDVCYNPGG
ncbi:hypothetical protein GIB67_020665 [Kingdonia uniflora]|uniref:Reverse transcriptase n=1 Tax=Kingdonia uniflora TaxID=39325 RepID=A0A7J7M975_9MAGN|nr:hypothetical protein GIB67_020665 [Kingdonia uniflora]